MANLLPGVVVRIVPEIAQVTLPAFPRYVCIIGQGEHRLRRNNEEVIRSATEVFDYLSKRPFLDIIRVGLVPDAQDFISPDHYVIKVEAGENVGIEWKPLLPAKTDDTLSISEPFDLSINNKIYLSVDGRPTVTITVLGANQSAVTAAEVATAINNALSTAYGSLYANVAEVFATNKVRLKAPNQAPYQGEKSIITVYTGANDCFETIFGDYGPPNYPDYPNVPLVLKGTGKQPNAGETYYVTYRYPAPDSTYEPTLYFDLKPILEEHGTRFLDDPSNPEHINEIALMAELAFQDLPGRIPGIVVAQLDFRSLSDPYNPTDFDRRTAFQEMIAKLERVTQGKLYIVPYTTDADTIDALFSHVKSMSRPEVKAERMLCITMPPNSTVNDYIGAQGAVKFNSERVMLFWPPEITVKTLNKKLPNIFAPLIYAAKKTSVPVGTPINVEELPGIILNTPATFNEKKALLAAGVSIIDIDQGRTVILHGITTRTDFVIYEEENVVDIADYVKAIWRNRMMTLFKNAPIDATTLSSMVSISYALMETLIRDRIITAVKDIIAVQDAVEPRMVRMRGKVKPMFHMLYMDIEFVFSTTI